METQIVFSLKELLMAGLFIALIALVIYIILLLREVLLSVKLLRTVVNEKRENIDQILEITPSIMGKVDHIAGLAEKGTETVVHGAMGIVDRFKK